MQVEGKLLAKSFRLFPWEVDMEAIKILQGDDWLKHPLHPALVAEPIGMWTFSLLMDGAASLTGNECAQEAADTAVTAGLVAAAVSGMAGLAEFMRVPPDEKSQNTAFLHGMLNISAVGLYAINAIIRTGRRKSGRPGGFLPKLLSLAGVAAISYSGWLGGNLVYNHGAGVHIQPETKEAEAKKEVQKGKGEVKQRETAAV